MISRGRAGQRPTGPALDKNRLPLLCHTRARRPPPREPPRADGRLHSEKPLVPAAPRTESQEWNKKRAMPQASPARTSPPRGRDVATGPPPPPRLDAAVVALPPPPPAQPALGWRLRPSNARTRRDWRGSMRAWRRRGRRRWPPAPCGAAAGRSPSPAAPAAPCPPARALSSCLSSARDRCSFSFDGKSARK